MSNPILNCSICNRDMAKGSRVGITLNWEYDANDVTSRIQKNKLICRVCATELSRLMNLEVPNV